MSTHHPDATRIFLSSTSLDLREHRAAVVRKCTARGYAVVAMEEFGAQDAQASSVSVSEVAPADVFVGLYARRYGFVPPGQTQSVTEMEYDEAARLSKPRLLFVVAPDYDEHDLLERHRDDDDAPAAEALARFLARVGQERVWDVFTTPEHLAERVDFALSKWQGWRPAAPPALPKPFVGRSDLLAELRGMAVRSGRIALTGIGGIGKSLTALRLAHDLASECTAGVLSVTLGPSATDPEVTRTAVARAWLARHHPGRLVDPATLTAPVVRAWLDEVPGRLLVMIDDVWDAAVANEILQLVPASAIVVATSRRGDAVRQLGIEEVREIDRLSDRDALDLLRDRVGDMPSRADLRRLIGVLGGHPLALEIAAAQIRREGPDFATTLPEALRASMEAGTAQAATGDEDIPTAVDAVLQLTYAAMGADLKRRFRALGALTVEAPVTPFLMAALWSVQPAEPEALDDAIDRMQALGTNAVLSRVPGEQLFSLHAVIRAYARRLLRHAAEFDDVDDRYAKAIVVTATSGFAVAPEAWGEMDPYLRHIAYVGDTSVAQLEDLLGPLAPLAEPSQVTEPLVWPLSDQTRRVVLRALNFAVALARYVRERQMEGVTGRRWLHMGVVAARALHEPRWVASFLMDAGTWLSRHGDPLAAVEHLAKAVELARAAQDEEHESTALHRLSLVYMNLGRYDDAAAIQERVVEIESRRGNVVAQGAALLAQGTLHRRRGDLAGAQERYLQALPLLADDLDSTATALNDIGVVYRAAGSPAEAGMYFEQALRAYRRTGNRREEANVLGNLAGIAWDTWDLDRAIELYTSELQMVRELGDRGAEAKVLVNLGTAYEKTGASGEALAQFEAALPVLRAIEDHATLAACLNNVAVARLAQGDPHTALGLLDEALQINQRLGDNHGVACVLNVMGDTWYALRDADRALSSYGAALEASREVGDVRTQAQVLQNLGILFHALQQHDRAEDFYQQSLARMRDCQNRNGEAVTLSNLASIRYTSGDPAGARSLYEEALAIMREIGDSRSEAAILRNLEQLEQETAAAAPPAAPQSAREILIQFMQSEGPARAVFYGQHAATLQSAEVDAMLTRMIASADSAGNRDLAEYGQSIREFLQRLRRV